MVPVCCPAVRVAGGPGTPRLGPSARACPWLSTGVPAQGSKPRSVLIPHQTRGVGSPCVARSLRYSNMFLPGVADCAEPWTDPVCSSAVLPPRRPPAPAGKALLLNAAEVFLRIYSYIPNVPPGQRPRGRSGLAQGKRPLCLGSECGGDERRAAGRAGRAPPRADFGSCSE